MNDGNHPAEGDAVPGESLEDVLASIRALVTAETSTRIGTRAGEGAVLMLTPDMRIEDDEDAPRSGEVLAEGLGPTQADGPYDGAPILDEEVIRTVVNRIVREELQGELGDRISRNLRKLIRREIKQLTDEGHDQVE